MRFSLTILLCLFLVHCSEDPGPEQPEHIFILDEIPQHIQKVENLTIYLGDSEPLYKIELIPVQSFGKTGQPYLTEIVGSVVDDKGRVIIQDMGSNYEHSIYVYNADGTFHTQLGGSGRGAGEYGFVFDVHAKSGKVFVRDITNQRLNIYNTEDYSFERSMLIEQLAIRNHEAVQDLQLGLILPRNDGNHLVNFYQRNADDGWPAHRYMLMDENGKAMEYESTEFRSSFKAQGYTEASIRMVYMPMPFIGGSVAGYSISGELYQAWNQDFLIRKYNATGEYQLAIYYAIKGSPFELSYHAPTAFFDEKDVIKALDLHNHKQPESNPIIDRLKVDDENRIWVAVPMDGQRKNYEWWILAPTGELLAKLQRPRYKTIFDIKNGYLYGKEIDGSTDAEYVVKYRIEIGEK